MSSREMENPASPTVEESWGDLIIAEAHVVSFCEGYEEMNSNMSDVVLSVQPPVAPPAQAVHNIDMGLEDLEEGPTLFINWPADDLKTAESKVSVFDPQRSENVPVEAMVTNLLSFKGCEELLRGTRLSTIMARRGHLFKESQGSEQTFMMSEQTATLDAFVSHNWAIPARSKYLVLSYYYNGHQVAGATTCTLLLIGLATYFGWMPLVEDKSMGASVGCLGRILWFPVGAILYAFWWDLAGRLGYQGPMLFLDKVCIHQTDPQMMRRGIEKLGAFIQDSKQMLALYSEEYLRRLWTVYEVATFLSIHQKKDLTLLPTSVPTMAVVILVALWVSQVCQVFLMLESSHSIFRAAPGATVCIGASIAFRVLFQNKQKMIATIDNFSVQKCVCAQESDRAQVYTNIEALMRSMGSFEPSASQEEVLAAFDQQVQRRLPLVLKKQMGKVILPYEKVVVLSIFNQLPWIVDKMVLLKDESLWKDTLISSYFDLVWIVVFSPGLILGLQWFNAKFLHLSGIWNILWCLLTSCLGNILTIVLASFTLRANDDPLRWGIAVNLLAIVMFLIGWCVRHT